MRCATVPNVGGDVQVRAIPPKLLRTIQAKSIRNGRIDLQELMVWKLVFGLDDPGLTEEEARAIALRFTVGALQPILDKIDELSGTDEHLAFCPRSHGTPIFDPITMATAWLGRFPDTPPRARTREAHRNGRSVRRRGSRRTTASRSGPDDDPGEGPGPAERRCENPRCQADIWHLHPLAHYCDDGGACKQQAYRDRRTIEHLDALTGTIAEHLSCVCEPRRNVVEHGHCMQCGYPRGPVVREWLTDPAPPARSYADIRTSVKRRPIRLGDGKRRPIMKREMEPAR